jgi:hypothetical protein
VVLIVKKISGVESRVFIIGCPRSGTTLLQALLASHSQITSFPESHFFSNLYPEHEPKRRLLGLASRRIKPCIFEFIESMDRYEFKSTIKPWTFFQFQYINRFTHILDQLTQERGKKIWVEKTPDHLRYTSEIQKSVKNSRFIHIIRNGLDVIASLYEVTQKHPDVWKGSWSLDQCIIRWIEAIEISRSYIGRENHTLVHYDKLSTETNSVLTDLCGFLNINFEPGMLSRSTLEVESLVMSHEPWKTRVSQEISPSRRSKYNAVFSESEKRYISEKLSSRSHENLFRELISFQGQ